MPSSLNSLLVPSTSSSSSSSSHQESPEQTSLINSLPKELILEIFSHLDLASLGAVSRVNKEWQVIANEPHLWKRRIYKEIACTSETLVKCFGEKVIEGEDQKEEWDSLPQNIVEILKDPCPVFPEKRVIDTHILVHIPKTINGKPLTLNSLGLLAKEYFPEAEKGYDYFCSLVANQLGNNPIDESRWVLMTKDIIPGSRNQTYVKQKAMIAAIADKALVSYEVPQVLEASFCILVHYFKCKEHLLRNDPLTYTRCQDSIYEAEYWNCLVVVGGFVPAGLDIHYHYNFEHDNNGVVALRKF